MSWTSTKKLAAHYIEHRRGATMLPPYWAEPVRPDDVGGPWHVRNAAGPSLSVGSLSSKFASDLAAAMNEVSQ